MEIKIVSRDDVTVVELVGNLDGASAPQAQGQIMPLIVPDCLLIVDMSQCGYVSSAGLRVLLMIAKLLNTKKGRGVLAGLSEEIQDVMEMTGFAQFFEIYGTVAEAMQAIRDT